MTKSSTNFTYHDPSRAFDGTPYQAAAKAVEQTRRVLVLLDRSLKDTNIQVRNAQMSRNMDLGGEPEAEAWDADPVARKLRAIQGDVNRMRRSLIESERQLRMIQQSAEFDPKHPPKELPA